MIGYFHIFFSSMIHGDPTCQNEKSGKRRTWKESDGKKGRGNSKPVVKESCIELKFKTKIYIN